MKKLIKKATKKKQPEPIQEIEQETGAFEPIALLGNDFGREDLNVLRDKLNEIISKYNGN